MAELTSPPEEKKPQQEGTESTAQTVTAPQPETSKFKKILYSLFGAWIGFGALVLGLGLGFLGAANSHITPIADAFGIDPMKFVQVLMAFSSIFFIFLAFASFAFAMVALFKSFIAKKEDPAKKTNTWKAILWGIMMIILLAAWFVMYMKLDAKQTTLGKPLPQAPIVTQPIETVNLTAPIQITFDATGMENVIDLTKYRIISYVWDFGDGQTGTGVKISHDYKNKGKNNGLFTVSLTVNMIDLASGETIKNNDQKVVVSISNVKTAAVFTATPEKGSAPLEVAFDASESSDPDGEIVKYEWDFSENGKYSDATGMKTKHVFDKTGNYTVSLRVTDNSGQYATSDKEIQISDAFSLQSVISVTAESTGKFLVNKNYLFDGSKSSSPDSTVTKYEWNFGDGSGTKKSKTVSYGYKKEGVYEVTLRVTDDKGITATKTQRIIVGNPPQTPKAVIETIPAKNQKGIVTGKAPLEIQFDASRSTDPDDNIVEYRWDFESDGTDDLYGANVSHIYEKEGTYQLTLIVADSDNNEVKEKLTIQVAPPGLQAKLTASPLTGVVPLLVSFDASASNYPDGQILSYEWNFGDKTPTRQDSAKISYKYNQVGTYTASVTALGADGKRDTATVLITVQVVPVKACYEVNKHSGKAPFEVIFNTTCATGTISKYRWDLNNDGIFGDATTPNITHTFDNPGTYKVSLEVTDQQGVVDIFSDTVVAE